MMDHSAPYPPLPQSYKHCFPFRLSVPSFIYPDSYVQNVRMLGPFVDEIELLLFESLPAGSLPSREDIEILRQMGEALDLTYNVHLPTDISLGASKIECQRAVDTLLHVMALVAPLKPITHTLHLPMDHVPGALSGDPSHNLDFQQWKDAIHSNLSRLLQRAGITGRQISVESLSYPLSWIADILSACDLAVCMDMGHLFLHGFDVEDFTDQFEERISMIHLHGVEAGKDHLSLDQLPATQAKQAAAILSRLKCGVSIEVFAYPRLVRSLAVLESWQ